MSEKQQGKIDWIFLMYLWLFTNQAVFSLKILGLVFIYLARWNWDFDIKNGRLPKFFLYILLLACFNFLFFIREFTGEYIVAFIVGNLFWVFSFLSAHQVKLSLERYGHSGVYKTMKVFVIVNLAFCIGQLINMILITGKINPYDANLPFPYGMSAGDNIFGSFMQNSYYNVMVSAILAVYFIFKRNFLFAILSATCFILVFGNFGTMVFVGILTAIFMAGFFAVMIGNNTDSKVLNLLRGIAPPGKFYLSVPALVLLVYIFYIQLSPKNLEYIVRKFDKTVFTIRGSEKNNYANMISDQEINPLAYDRFSRYNQKIDDSLKAVAVELAKVTSTDTASVKKAKKLLTDGYIRRLQGKNLSVIETEMYLKSSPAAFMFGAGTTRFSSLTAQKMSGFDSSRLFMYILPHYIAKPYSENHYLLIEGRKTAGDDALLSTANWPDSLYNQLFGEYGMSGAFVFLVFYLGFYIRRIKFWSYSFWVMCIFLPFAHMNYIFETLCVAPFFELLIEADIREQKELGQHDV